MAIKLPTYLVLEEPFWKIIMEEHKKVSKNPKPVYHGLIVSKLRTHMFKNNPYYSHYMKQSR